MSTTTNTLSAHNAKRRKSTPSKNVIPVASESSSSSSSYAEFEEEVKSEAVSARPSIRSLSDSDAELFAGMTDEDFVLFVSHLVIDRKHLELENRAFEDFLSANDKALLDEVNYAKESFRGLKQLSQMLHTDKADDKRMRINFSQRTDLVLRDNEAMQEQLNRFLKTAKRQIFLLKAEIEESGQRLDDIQDSRQAFEQEVVVGGLDPITQRIPAEKFVRYIQDWLKTARLTIEKLRLRNSSLKMQYNKLKAIYSQKVDLGESIHGVDFEQLRIAHAHLVEDIELKNTHLMEMNNMSGAANLNLATSRSYLQKITYGLKVFQQAIDSTVAETGKFQKEIVQTQKELKDAEVAYKEIKYLIKNFKVPEVMDYVNIKAKLFELKKKMKVLNRKDNILKIILNSNTKMMMKLTGEKPKRNWYRKKPEEDIDDYDTMPELDEHFYRNTQSTMEFDLFDVFAD